LAPSYFHGLEHTSFSTVVFSPKKQKPGYHLRQPGYLLSLCCFLFERLEPKRRDRNRQATSKTRAFPRQILPVLVSLLSSPLDVHPEKIISDRLQTPPITRNLAFLGG
jgi:hypothetical protein